MNIQLRSWTKEDIPNLINFANNPRIAQWLTDAFPHPYGEEQALAFLEMIESKTPGKVFAIDLDGEAIGAIGIHPQSDIYRLNAELGYWLGEPFWGQGIMVDAIALIVDWTWSNLDVTRIYAVPFGENMRSARVLEKAGFSKEALIKHGIIKNDVIYDQVIYAIRRP